MAANVTVAGRRGGSSREERDTVAKGTCLGSNSNRQSRISGGCTSRSDGAASSPDRQTQHAAPDSLHFHTEALLTLISCSCTVLTHSHYLTHSTTHSDTCSPSSLTPHSTTQPLTQTLANLPHSLLTHSLTHSRTYSLTHHSPTHSLTNLPVCSAAPMSVWNGDPRRYPVGTRWRHPRRTARHRHSGSKPSKELVARGTSCSPRRLRGNPIGFNFCANAIWLSTGLILDFPQYIL